MMLGVMVPWIRRAAPVMIALASLSVANGQASAPNPNRPSLFLVGDLSSSSVGDTFDPNRIKLVESGAVGQTSRAYIKSGAWDQLAGQIKPGDFVLIEFNPEGQGGQDHDDAQRTLKGMGDGTFDYLDPGTKKLELVHSYGWYLRKIVVDAINHGANPILCSPLAGAKDGAGDWTKAIATEQRIPFVDLSGTGVKGGLVALKADPLAAYLVGAGK
ncbi:SGNH/GDSL hydrolase family protein [Granulicella tundricola]|uniref:Rhamnogalacturonan acetylesterase n=1 Tax=Granulicella tundricola (strain ATCC BAA-1859 / DSM 23138 / MP5ACTX9) TaxID=1198114 RepID=E8X2H3_GRATM|nr:rhamnogalacturonan acetylesterase [Granulicella tundricola]ADW69197.1 rhamnogalacturonan acetylesterase [Granulicella tundricola MP5ACTX9]